MKQLYKIYYLICLLTGLSLTAKAQETAGSLTGRILDEKGETMPGVTVLATHTPSGTKYSGSTGKDGTFFLPGARIGGPYTVTVTFIGYINQTKGNITVTLGQAIEVNFKLEPESKQLQTVTIKGTATPNRNVGQNIDRTQLRTLPSISRSLQDFTRLTPQANNNSFAGTNYRYNNVTIDGAINNDAIGFTPSLGGQNGTSGQPGSSTRSNSISLDAVEAVQVYISPYDVKLGNFSGGSINAVTRSGTNEVTGSIYAFGRNASITGPDNAGDGSKMPSAFHEYQTGFRLGFPIIKNKLFWFTNEEITDRQDPILLTAGSQSEKQVISADSAKMIQNYLISKYHFDPGTYGQYNIYSKSQKFFNRMDWNINDKNQLTIRNNTVNSAASNLERDQQDFRFSSMDYEQQNLQISTVAELHTRFSNTFSNDAIVGYTWIHDWRTPSSDPSFPQVQIVGATPGTTIFLGTDREAAIFNMYQKTTEITDNFTIRVPKNTITIGTHNELYNINYGFVNSWNGRVDYNSVSDFLNNKPARVRDSYNYTNNTRDYILNNPGAIFKVNMYSFYAQDDIQWTPRLKISPGIRVDLSDVPDKQQLSYKTTSAPIDPYYGSTYTYTQPQNIRNDYLGIEQFSPRVGFTYAIKEDRSMVLRGGSGIFTSRIPFAWIAYAFYNNGNTYGAYDQRYNIPYAPGSDPLGTSPIGNAQFARQNGQSLNNPLTATQVDMIDNNFQMPQVWKSSLALDYSTPDKYNFTIEGLYTKTLHDIEFQQTNIPDNPTYYAYDTQHQQPIFNPVNTKISSNFTNAYLLSNTTQGYTYHITLSVKKNYDWGLGFTAAYTYGQAKDIANGIRNSLESNWQLNQALNPNNPTLANSNFDIRHRIVSTVNYHFNWAKGKAATNFALFFNAASGSPYTWGFVNATIQNTPQQVSLAYIPSATEAVKFFQDQPGGQTAAQQAAAFNQFINQYPYLNSKRGSFTLRNQGRTPWNNDLDFRLSQDFNIKANNKNHTLEITYDIINLTNLIDKSWGWVYFSPSTFNSTASVGLTQVLMHDPTDVNAPSPDLQRLIPKVVNGYPVYTFQDPGKPYSIDFMNSRWQMQVGARYSF